jgi:membrane-associated phospholipid phosphatase
VRFRLPFHVSLYLVIGFVASVICLTAFAALADEINEQETLVEIDMAIADSLHQQVTDAQGSLYWFISLFGSQVVFIIAVAVGVYLIYKRQWKTALVWGIALGGGQLLNLLLKAVFARPRPVYSTQFVQEINASFPSGHAMLSMICYGMIAYLAMRLTPNLRARILIAFAATLIVVLISISRMYLGVHYLSDVVAGMAAGGLWLSVCTTAMERLRRRKSNQKDPAQELSIEEASNRQ